MKTLLFFKKKNQVSKKKRGFAAKVGSPLLYILDHFTPLFLVWPMKEGEFICLLRKWERRKSQFIYLQ
jgi:hypothetical protein